MLPCRTAREQHFRIFLILLFTFVSLPLAAFGDEQNTSGDNYLPYEVVHSAERGHDFYMAAAVNEALDAARQHEYPVGAVLVKNGVIIAAGHNTQTLSHDPSAHAEMNVIREVCEKEQTRYLKDYVLYTSMEPCPMCLTAIVEARIPVVVYGTRGVWGALGTRIDLIKAMDWSRYGSIEVVPDVLAPFAQPGRIESYVQSEMKNKA